MSIEAHRWLMNAVNTPLERATFNALAGEGEVVVQVAGCGVCHTDLGYFYDGVRTNHALPLALGHEISGRVVEAGKGAEQWLGKAVIIPAVLPCGECDLCRRRLGTICRSQKMPGNDIHGGFASHIVVPGRGLCEVDEARLAAAGLTLAEVSIVADALTTPYQAVRRAGVEPGSLAVVIGAGGVGGYCVQIASANGAKVVAIDVDDAKLEAIAGYGAALTLNSRQLDTRGIKAAIADFAKKNGLRSTEWFIFECSGTAPGQLTAFGLLVHGATLSVVGFTMDRIEVRLSNLMAFDARAIGNWGCPPEYYPAALDLVLDGKVQLEPFVELHRLDDINRVFDAVHHREIRKRAVLVP
ncbi:MAG: 6-hydroxycyclohex-1-ene-1-carbonyl-CoA dehydrogenase [Lautropia sp.]|nr:MAG: 6-hydroxycyclohex-1-ene-1-carbonyl-CoA dehydrogenase [Pseudomonadota bacterium]MBC6958948.1 6-hydroxycyclohex-1-ene-1-carbonyl-CoA dehydrogenase [Lautropia sp.]MCL4701096.1 6-hydroxycyclohex-1-ene-1-carbonyl-CoA dehydrogenase [Burkholderiaceae bacterium]MDL1908685.1 6-hydroxycyclohex-1-ene-1-carbonyl-CoA dehydrogenase [Betaproteobacteria bacterium PRO1]RIK90477.1 MAG: 6-hydroxycyclohex-1-ene-1-carbonyl-CoA dehydrogenase [Burkholderiales bacterium]